MSGSYKRSEKVSRVSVPASTPHLTLQWSQPDQKKSRPMGGQWTKIEADDKYRRVILLEDRETVHNAFFDLCSERAEHGDEVFS
jgi:hypothetical protein